MFDYKQLVLAMAPITEESLILFNVSPEEKSRIVKQFNRALINAQRDGTDVAQIFLRPLITEYPTWGDAALIFGLCLAQEYQFKRAGESIEFAISNVISTENNLAIAQEALRHIQEDIKNPPKPPQVQTQDKNSMVSEIGGPQIRSGMQAPILMKASKSPLKASMASDKERRDVMMKAAASSNGELPDDDIKVEIPSTPADRMRTTLLVIGIVLGVVAIGALIYFLIIPAVVNIKMANDNKARLDYLTDALGENRNDPTVESILNGYLEEFQVDLSATVPSDESSDVTSASDATVPEVTAAPTETETTTTEATELRPTIQTVEETTPEESEGSGETEADTNETSETAETAAEG